MAPKSKKAKTPKKGSGPTARPISPARPEGGVAQDVVVKTRAAMAEVEGRMARVEGGFDRLATMMSSIQRTVEHQAEVSKILEGNSRASRRRHQSSPRVPRGRSPSNSDSEVSTDQLEGSRRTRSSSRRGKDSVFDQRNFVEKSVKIDSLEALFLVNIRTVLIMLKQGEPVVGLLEHMELMCEKALTKVYRVNSLIAYDKCVRERADAKGLEVFGTVYNSDVLRYFSYDSTVVSSSRLNKSSKSSSSNRSAGKNPCFAFNRGGCESSSCRYQHACMFCKSSSHGSQACSTGNPKTDK